MQKEPEFTFTQKDIDFGRTRHTPNIHYAKVIDIDGQPLKIPYLMQKVQTISQLLQAYWSITSHKGKFKGKACFRIIAGKDSKNIADQTRKLKEFDLSRACFRVEDSEAPNELFTDIEEMIKEQSSIEKEQDMTEILLVYNGKKIQKKVLKTLTIALLKKQLIMTIPGLQKQSQQSITLIIEGTRMDSHKRIENFDTKKQIRIVIVSKSRSYKGTTKVLLPEKVYAPINELKVGSTIMTFNRQNFSIEEAQITQLHESMVTEMTVVKLKNGHQIKLTSNHMFLCQDGAFRLIKSKDPKELCLLEKQKLRLFSGETKQVVSIQQILIPPEPFYSVVTNKNGNIIIDGGVVSHEQYIKVKDIQSNFIYPVDIASSDKIKSIKEKLQILTYLNLSNRNIIYLGQKINEEQTLADKKIKNQSTIYLGKAPEVQEIAKQEECINFVILSKGAQRQKISVNLPKNIEVLQAKERLEQQIKIPKEKQHFSFQGQILLNTDTFEKLKITNEHVIVVKQSETVYRSSIFLLDNDMQEQVENKKKKITFQRDAVGNSIGQKYVLEYEPFKDWKLKQIFKQYMGITDPAYFIIFADLFVFSYQPLSQLEQSQSFYDPELTVFVLKNQKLSFLAAMEIDVQKVKNSSSFIFQKEDLSQIPAKSQICVPKTQQFTHQFNKTKSSIQNNKNLQADLKKQYFYEPFVYFSSREYNKQIENYIKNFDEKREQVDKFDSMFAIIKALYYNMQYLPNHTKVCFYGVRNFRGSMFFSPGNTFYFHSFTLTFDQKSKLQQELSIHSGTLFHIQSTCSKLIQQFSFQSESTGAKKILLNPYTYFLVQRVVQGDKYDEIWLTQIASPVTFKKDIILWVDDEPYSFDNQTCYATILNNRPDLQILQVTSTAAAEHWIEQFGWILGQKGLQFKLISDMTRIQWKGDKQQKNYEAGIDLIQLLYKLKGYTAETLIFCGNSKKAQQIANKRQIPKERYQITVSRNTLYAFAGCIEDDQSD